MIQIRVLPTKYEPPHGDVLQYLKTIKYSEG
jgi:hypothetical protein